MRYPLLLEQGQQDWPLLLSQGANYFESFQYVGSDDVPFNLTGYEAEMQIRRTPGSDDPPLLTLTSDPEEGIQIDELNGTVIVSISSAQTAALPLMEGENTGWYDILLTAPGADAPVEKIVSGPVTVGATVTR